MLKLRRLGLTGHMMIWVDYCILALIIVSVIVGLIRGFARETLGLLTWILAFWLALTFEPQVAKALEPHISAPSVREAAAYAVLFLGGLLVGGIFTAIVSHVIRDSLFSSADRTLGAGFGLIRGALLVALFVLFAGQTQAKDDPWFRQSKMVAQFGWLSEGLRTLIPEAWLEKLKPATQIQLPAAAPADAGRQSQR